MTKNILQQKTGFSTSNSDEVDWRDHTALGYYSIADEIAWLLDVLQDPEPGYDPWLMGFGDPPCDADDRVLLAETLQAYAGLKSYPALIVEYCQLVGEEAREWLDAEGRP